MRTGGEPETNLGEMSEMKEVTQRGLTDYLKQRHKNLFILNVGLKKQCVHLMTLWCKYTADLTWTCTDLHPQGKQREKCCPK